MPKIKYSNRERIIEDFTDFDTFINDNRLSVDGKAVLLTKENAVIIERLIENDDEYFPFSKLLFNYYGPEKVKKNINNALFAVARGIDRDNNTNVWRYKKNRNSFYNLISYISDPDNSFFERLEKGDITLPDEIVDRCGTRLKSLSSKVCKYLSEFVFQKDNYYINDSFVRRMLLFYLDRYKVEHRDLKSSQEIDEMDYKTLYYWLTRLHNARNKEHGDTITKSELDHILWYCYKSFDL